MRPWLHMLGKLLLGSLLLIAAAAAALQLRPIRLILRDQLLSAIKGHLDGELELADVRWPMLDHLELSGLRLRDKHGTHVAGLSKLRAQLRYRSLLAGQIELERLEVSDLYVDLADLSDEYGLVSVFARSAPKPPEPAADSGMSPLPFVVRELCIDRGELRVAPAADQRFSIRRLNGCVRLRVAQHLQIAIHALEARLLRNDAEVAHIASPDQLARSPLGRGAANGGPMLLSVEGQLAVGKDTPFDARARVRNLSGDSLRALGVSGEMLRGSIDLDLHASQSRGRLRYRAQLASDAGALLAHGELDAQRRLWLQMQTGALSLAKITNRSLPILGFALDAQLALEQIDEQALTLHVSRGYYGSWPLPEVSLQAVREASGRVVVNNIQAKQAHAELNGHAQLQPDGAAEASLRLSVPNLAELAPLQSAGLSGSVDAAVSARRGADKQLDAHADVRVQQLRTSTSRAKDLRLRAHVTGKSERPVVQLDIKGEQLEIGGHQVGEVVAALSGGPARYELTLAADQRFVRLDGWAEPRAGGWYGRLSLLAALDQGLLSLQLPFVRFVPAQLLELKQLHASFQKAALWVDGELDLRSPSGRLRFVADVPSVGLLAQALGQEPLPGRAELTGVLRGQLTRPALELHVRYEDGPTFAGAASQLMLNLRADAGKRRSHVDLQASAGTAHVAAELESRWSQGMPLSATARTARHELALELHSVSLAELLERSGAAPLRLLDGMLSGNVTARGNLDKLQLTTHLASLVRVARDPSTLHLVLDASYENAALELALDGGDRRGQLLQLKAAAHVALERQLKQPQPWQQLLHASAWQLSSALAERYLGELPWLASSGLEQDLALTRLALHASLEHEPHHEPSGIFEAQLRWAPLGVPPKVSGRSATCNDHARGELLLSGKWAKQKLGVELHGGPRSDEAIRVSARMPAPFAELLGGQRMDLPGLQLLVQLNQLDLGNVPWICEQGAGNVSLTAKARDLMTAGAEVSLQTETHALRWGESPPLDIAMEAHSAPQAVHIAGEIQTSGASLHLQGQAPIDVRARSPAAMLQRSGPLQLDLTLARLPMAALLGFVPGVARVSGTTSGQIEVRGSVEKPGATGQLSFDDVSLTLPRLGRRFSHVSVKATLDDNTLRLSDGKLRDLDGSATLAALLSLEPQGAWRAELNLNARRFPLRKSGVMMGRADANARVVAESTREKTTVEVQLARLAVDLSRGDTGHVQRLQPNPEFTFIDGRLGANASKRSPYKNKYDSERLAPTDIHVLTSGPLWVRRDDFAVQMSTDLRITLGGKTPLLQGEISLLRGYIRLLGQSFKIKRGRVVLAGGESLDPQLEITAEHDVPGGTRVRLEVKGFVRAPELAFFVNDQATTAGDALLAITGRNDRFGNVGSAQQQMASAAIGMTTGLLSLGARRELGAFIPVLFIEQGEQTRVRVGIEADRFIPNILRGFVRGAYAEGIVASGSSSGGAAVASGQSGGSTSMASGTGVLLELMLPKNFVWAGQYGPGQTWSFDLDWRP